MSIADLRQEYTRASLSEDAREAYLAAKEQRPPKFTGR